MFIRKPEDVIYISELVERLRNTSDSNVEIDYIIANYIGLYSDLFPMTNFYGAPNKTTIDNLENQRRLSVRWLKKHETKRRLEWTFDVVHWYLAIVFLDEEPIVLLRSPNVRNDGYSKLFYLNKILHQEATSFIFSKIEADPGPELEMWGLDAPSGAYSGDVQPHIRSMNYDPAQYFNWLGTGITNEKKLVILKELNYLLNYTIDPHFSWLEVNNTTGVAP